MSLLYLDNNGTTPSEELLRELEILKHVNSTGHPNIIGLVGACTLAGTLYDVLDLM